MTCSASMKHDGQKWCSVVPIHKCGVRESNSLFVIGLYSHSTCSVRDCTDQLNVMLADTIFFSLSHNVHLKESALKDGPSSTASLTSIRISLLFFKLTELIFESYSNVGPVLKFPIL